MWETFEFIKEIIIARVNMITIILIIITSILTLNKYIVRDIYFKTQSLPRCVYETRKLRICINR